MPTNPLLKNKEAQEFIDSLIAHIVVNKRKDLLAILRKNGVVVKDNVGDTELITATYVAFAKSPSFKKDLHSLSKAIVNDQLNYVDEPYLNVVDVVVPDATTVAAYKDTSSSGGKTKVGAILSNLFTPERTNQLLDMGLNLLNTKLTNASNKGVLQQTVAANTSQTQAQIALAAAEEAKAKTAKEKNKWVVPTIIGGVVIITAGIAAYFIFKKKS